MNFELLKNSLSVIGIGYLGIFVVTAVIIAIVYILNSACNALENRKKDK